jgi:hypothetical protein
MALDEGEEIPQHAALQIVIVMLDIGEWNPLALSLLMN